MKYFPKSRTVKLGLITLRNVHTSEECIGDHCWIHNPSDHPLDNHEVLWRTDRGFPERICDHGVGHPDPDHLEWERTVYGQTRSSIHGCCGCCLVVES